MDIKQNIISREELPAFRGSNRDKRIVFTNGCFDLIHRGHVQLLREARNLGDLLVVGLNSDSSARRLKGQSRPLTSEMDRAFVLLSLEAVDYVTLFDEDTPIEVISALEPDVLVKGAEYGAGEIVGEDFVSGRGGTVVRVDMLEGCSTSALIEKIKNLD
jgi:D-beta-D-heptose 7-phosphate kinase/D-beta-D-heptose 1-phosphate adenosyltransferase